MIKTDSVASPDSVDQALSFIFTDYEPTCLRPERKELIQALFMPQSPSFLQHQIRLAFQTFSNIVPTSLRLLGIKFMRRFRNLNRAELRPASQCTFNQIVTELDNQGLTRRGYQGYPAVVCLSYDLDRLVGYNYLEQIAETLDRLHLKATFNILTNWEYDVNGNKIRKIFEAGFEIGLHGGRHDIGLGYRSTPAIRSELKQALSVIPFEVHGYRAPALCMTPNLMQVVGELGFKYDSSLPMTNMYYKSVETCFPYPCPGVGTAPCSPTKNIMWEFPVTIQDTTFFLDLNLSEEEALRRMISNIDDIVKLGGVNIINLHPYIAVDKIRFHQRLLDYLSNKANVLVCTQKELYDNIQSVTSNVSNTSRQFR